MIMLPLFLFRRKKFFFTAIALPLFSSIFFYFFLGDSGTFFRIAPFSPVISRFSCADVGSAVKLSIHPQSGATTNQFERRAMIEKRIYDCFWRSWRYTQTVAQGVRPELREEIKAVLNQTAHWTKQAQEIYSEGTLKPFRNQEQDYHISEHSDAWFLGEIAIEKIRKSVLMLNTKGIALDEQDHQETLAFLGLFQKKDAPIIHEEEPRHSASGKGEQINTADDRLGLLHNAMAFPRLSKEQKNVLNEVQRLHTMWAQAVLSEKNQKEIDELVESHHALHHHLETLARTPDQQALITIPQHSGHEICRNRPAEEVKQLVLRTEIHHLGWEKAVERLDFKKAWQEGLRHAETHAMLATCGVILSRAE